MEYDFIKMGFEKNSVKEEMTIYQKEFSKEQGTVQICVMYDTKKRKISSVEGIYIHDEVMEVLPEKEIYEFVAI